MDCIQILTLLIHSYVKIKCCTWCLQVAPPIWEFVVYLINVLCSFEQSELGHNTQNNYLDNNKPVKTQFFPQAQECGGIERLIGSADPWKMNHGPKTNNITIQFIMPGTTYFYKLNNMAFASKNEDIIGQKKSCRDNTNTKIKFPTLFIILTCKYERGDHVKTIIEDYYESYFIRLNIWTSLTKCLSVIFNLLQWASEWMLFNAKWAIFRPYDGENKLLFMQRWWWCLFCTHVVGNIVLAHWNNTSQIDMSLHSDTLSWLWADYFFLFTPYIMLA